MVQVSRAPGSSVMTQSQNIHTGKLRWNTTGRLFARGKIVQARKGISIKYRLDTTFEEVGSVVGKMCEIGEADKDGFTTCSTLALHS